jgi:hypothetical protein
MALKYLVRILLHKVTKKEDHVLIFRSVKSTICHTRGDFQIDLKICMKGMGKFFGPQVQIILSFIYQ